MSWRRKESANASSPGRKPSLEDFTPVAVRRAVLSETLQHPATVIPLAATAVATAWSVVIAASPASLGIAVLAGFVGVSAWVVNFIIRGPKLAERHVQVLRDERIRHELRSADDLATECSNVGFTEGEKECNEIKVAYERLRDRLLELRKLDTGFQVDQFLTLGEDSYQGGLAILEKALGIFKMLSKVDIDELESELDGWCKKLGNKRVQLSDAERKALDVQVSSHERRIALYREKQAQLPMLIAEANDVETALVTAYLEANSLAGSDLNSLSLTGKAGTELQRAVDVARDVEERLRALGNGNGASDDVYLKAADHN